MVQTYIAPATQEAELYGSPEPDNLRPAWATVYFEMEKSC